EVRRAKDKTAVDRLVLALPVALILLVLGPLSFVLIHAAWTGDFLGFLPDAARRSVEAGMGIAAPAPGAGTRWRLEFQPYLIDAASDPWLAGFLALAGGALVVVTYLREGQTARTPYRLLLAGLRVCSLLLTL